MLTKVTIAYLLEELQSRENVLDDLIMHGCGEELEGWITEQAQLEKAIEELHQCCTN